MGTQKSTQRSRRERTAEPFEGKKEGKKARASEGRWVTEINEKVINFRVDLSPVV